MIRRGEGQAAVREIMFLLGVEWVSPRKFGKAVAAVRKVKRAPNTQALTRRDNYRPMATPETQNVQRPVPFPQARGSALQAITKLESELREKAKTVMQQGDRPGFVRLAAMADGTKVARDRIVESFAQWLKQPAEPFIDHRMGLVNRITQYLCVGGLVNPEMMEHEKVRDLLVDVREYLLADSSPTVRTERLARMATKGK